MKKITTAALLFCFALCVTVPTDAYDKQKSKKAIEEIITKDEELKSGRLEFIFDEKRFFGSVYLGYMYREEIYEKGKNMMWTDNNRGGGYGNPYRNMSKEEKASYNAVMCIIMFNDDYLTMLKKEKFEEKFHVIDVDGTSKYELVETEFKLTNFEESQDHYKFYFDVVCKDGDGQGQSKMEEVFHKGEKDFFPVEIAITSGKAVRKIVYTKKQSKTKTIFSQPQKGNISFRQTRKTL
jgi:hypothetical protein